MNAPATITVISIRLPYGITFMAIMGGHEWGQKSLNFMHYTLAVLFMNMHAEHATDLHVP